MRETVCVKEGKEDCMSGKGKSSYLEIRLYDNAINTLPGSVARWTSVQSATINPAFYLCTRYPLRLSGAR